MRISGYTANFREDARVDHRYVKGCDEALAIEDEAITLILPLSSTSIPSLAAVLTSPFAFGSMLFVPPNRHRHIDLRGRFDLLVITIGSGLARWSEQDADEAMAVLPAQVQLVSHPQQISALVQLTHRMAAAGGECAASCIRLIARLLLWEVVLGEGRDPDAGGKSIRGLGASGVEVVDRYIETNLEGPISVQDLSDAAGLSRYYFIRSFKQMTGLTPLQYVIVKRVEQARSLLQTSPDAIADIAYATGFSSQSHLNWAFKRHFGVTPGAYKKSHRKTD